MPDIESLLKRWLSAGVLDAEAAASIRAYEAHNSPVAQRGMRWQGITALILGAILLACGMILFVSAHWDQFSPATRFVLVLLMLAVFHKSGALARPKYLGLSTALHAVGTVAAGAAIALTGQIFNIEDHWPTAVLLWAVCALAGWALLHDQAQQTLALLLVPAWIICELDFRMDGHIGEGVYMGRVVFLWTILYITFFIGSRRKAVQGILFAAGVVGAVLAIYAMLSAWECQSATQTFIPFGTRLWAWIAIAAIPLIVAAFHGHKGLVPIAVAIGFVLALPWCYRTITESFTTPNGMNSTWVHTEPNLLAYALVAAFAVFLCGWGVRLVSRALVNLGIAGFASTVAWFYFSDILNNKMNRSLGLIGLGILFLAGGWALEKTRRRILTGIAPASEGAAPLGGAQ